MNITITGAKLSPTFESSERVIQECLNDDTIKLSFIQYTNAYPSDIRSKQRYRITAIGHDTETIVQVSVK